MNNTEVLPAEFFQDVKAIAVVGVSERKTKFGPAAFRELKKRGFEVFPVHRVLEFFDDGPCYHSAAALPKTPDCVCVSVQPYQAPDVVRQFAERGTKKFWFQRGADFSEAAALAAELGLQAVEGKCILMYAGQATGIHKFHRALSRLFGKY